MLNGGITSITQAREHLSSLDGVMIGREADQNPWILAFADQQIFGDSSLVPTRHEVLDAYLPYIDKELAAGTPLHSMPRHILGLFQGQPGARFWRRTISENAHRPDAGPDLLLRATPLDQR